MLADDSLRALPLGGLDHGREERNTGALLLVSFLPATSWSW